MMAVMGTSGNMSSMHGPARRAARRRRGRASTAARRPTGRAPSRVDRRRGGRRRPAPRPAVGAGGRRGGVAARRADRGGRPAAAGRGRRRATCAGRGGRPRRAAARSSASSGVGAPARPAGDRVGAAAGRRSSGGEVADQRRAERQRHRAVPRRGGDRRGRGRRRPRPRRRGRAARSRRRRPALHSAAATRRSWPTPVCLATLAETASTSWSRRVSSTKPIRLPVPTWTKTRTPSSWRRVDQLAEPHRLDQVAAGQLGDVVGVVGVRRHGGGRPQRHRRRHQRDGAELRGHGRRRTGRTAASGSPERNGSSWARTLRSLARSMAAAIDAAGAQITDWWGQLSWET